jgi:hypothetical protein
MQDPRSLTFLRRILSLDAACSAAMGIVLIMFAPTLGTWLGLPADLLREAGIVLLPFAVFVCYVASLTEPSRLAVWSIIVLNAIWTLDSIALLMTDWVSPTALGTTFIVGQALSVAGFAELEYIALRKATHTVAT